MYHDMICAILSPLKPGMKTPVIRCCPDGHFHRVIYDLAAYITDYPEQVYLAGIVQNWCPKYNHSSSYVRLCVIIPIIYFIDVHQCTITLMAKWAVDLTISQVG
jgi:Plavaka transposase